MGDWEEQNGTPRGTDDALKLDGLFTFLGYYRRHVSCSARRYIPNAIETNEIRIGPGSAEGHAWQDGPAAQAGAFLV
jgi:hypothetical protein